LQLEITERVVTTRSSPWQAPDAEKLAKLHRRLRYGVPCLLPQRMPDYLKIETVFTAGLGEGDSGDEAIKLGDD